MENSKPRLFKLAGGLQDLLVYKNYKIVADYVIVHPDGIAEAGIFVRWQDKGIEKIGVRSLQRRLRPGNEWVKLVETDSVGEPVEDQSHEYFDGLEALDVNPNGLRYFRLSGKGGWITGTAVDIAGGLIFGHILVEADGTAYVGDPLVRRDNGTFVEARKLGSEFRAPDNWMDLVEKEPDAKPVNAQRKARRKRDTGSQG